MYLTTGLNHLLNERGAGLRELVSLEDFDQIFGDDAYGTRAKYKKVVVTTQEIRK